MISSRKKQALNIKHPTARPDSSLRPNELSNNKSTTYLKAFASSSAALFKYLNWIA